MSEFIEEFSKIPGINVDSALQLCGGEENLIDIAATFAETGDKRLEELSEALSDSDLKRITIISHALKSAAALLGADELSTQAKTIEVIARAENLVMIRDKVPAFLDEYEAYVYAVMDVVARCSNIDPEALKAKQDAVIAMNSLEKGAEKNTVLIGHGQSFLISALEHELLAQDLSVKLIDPERDSIKKYDNNTGVFILYLGEYQYRDTEILKKLAEICEGKKRLLFLVGTKAEIQTILSYVALSSISGIFLKPLETKSFVKKVITGIETFSRKRIFVVDDDETYLTGLSDWLGRKYRVETLSSGAAALEAIQESRPDLIMLDYEMPGLSGPEVMRVLKDDETTKDIPIIFLSGMDDKESIVKVMSYHPADYLLKTKGAADILRAVDAFFEGAENEKIAEEEEMPELSFDGHEDLRPGMPSLTPSGGQDDDDFVLPPFFGGFIKDGFDFFEKEGNKK